MNPEITIEPAPQSRIKRNIRLKAKRKTKTGTSGCKTKKQALKRKIKTKSISKLRKELEALQKQVVIKLYGRDCFTCPQKNLTGKNCQLGHVPWPRTALSTESKFDHRYTRIQCFNCNINKGGMGAVAYKRMVDEFGLFFVESLWSYSESTKGRACTRDWFLTKIRTYQAILDNV